ncbi:hypothetical protein [Telmatospirillum sp.]|uniref:hypothetical protein n=1 Tax=Telmatospirillum sp. TaxID=2079197 RepID=UPI00283CA98C|nr:hypothetical protein [Telmatospirillum sp.]MDR3441255.1 hypothetical protein [Telmatospirillum sp.]
MDCSFFNVFLVFGLTTEVVLSVFFGVPFLERPSLVLSYWPYTLPRVRSESLLFPTGLEKQLFSLRVDGHIHSVNSTTSIEPANMMAMNHGYDLYFFDYYYSTRKKCMVIASFYPHIPQCSDSNTTIKAMGYRYRILEFCYHFAISRTDMQPSVMTFACMSAPFLTKLLRIWWRHYEPGRLIARATG